MEEKKILLGLVVVAALATGWVLVQDAKTSVNNPQEIEGVKKTASTQAVKAEKQIGDSAQTATTEPAGGSVEAAGTNSSNNSNNKNMQLEIKTTQEGTGDRVVKAGDKISVLYTGKLEDGSVFDASSLHGGTPFDFTVGQGMVIKGWDQGLLGAKVGEKRTLTIPGDLGYGAQGYPPKIPANATLIFDVELVSFK